MDLKDFVEICNKGDEKYIKGNRDSAYYLGKDIANLKKAKDEGRNIDDVKGLKDKDSKDFFKWLLKHTDENSYYTFQQKPEVVAEINAFEPFIDGNIKPEYLNQKWHVLISVLALLDMWQCNKIYEGTKSYKGKIEKIKINVEKDWFFYVYFTEENTCATFKAKSGPMKQWILSEIELI